MKAEKPCLVALALLSLLVLGGCATTEVAYEDNFFGLESKGEIDILLSRAVPQLTVLVDDRLVLDARGWNTRRVDVRNVRLHPRLKCSPTAGSSRKTSISRKPSFWTGREAAHRGQRPQLQHHVLDLRHWYSDHFGPAFGYRLLLSGKSEERQ